MPLLVRTRSTRSPPHYLFTTATKLCVTDRQRLAKLPHPLSTTDSSSTAGLLIARASEATDIHLLSDNDKSVTVITTQRLTKLSTQVFIGHNHELFFWEQICKYYKNKFYCNVLLQSVFHFMVWRGRCDRHTLFAPLRVINTCGRTKIFYYINMFYLLWNFVSLFYVHFYFNGWVA